MQYLAINSSHLEHRLITGDIAFVMSVPRGACISFPSEDVVLPQAPVKPWRAGNEERRGSLVNDVARGWWVRGSCWKKRLL